MVLFLFSCSEQSLINIEKPEICSQFIVYNDVPVSLCYFKYSDHLDFICIAASPYTMTIKSKMSNIYSDGLCYLYSYKTNWVYSDINNWKHIFGHPKMITSNELDKIRKELELGVIKYETCYGEIEEDVRKLRR